MKSIVHYSLVFFWGAGILYAQDRPAVYLSKKEIEQQFLDNNLQLIAQKFAIELAQAEVIQAKLWPNPTFSVSEVNMWKNGSSETLPSLYGRHGQHQQIALEIEQLIETAGKRQKRIQLQQLYVKDQELSFQETLRELKFDLRQHLIDLQALQAEEQLIVTQLELFKNLSDGYEKQWKAGNVSEMDFVRIAAEKLNFESEITVLQAEKTAILQKINHYVSNPNPDLLVLTDDWELPQILLENQPFLLDTALENRNDFQLIQNQLQIGKQQLAVEKAEKVPNITISASYDRGGNIMRDFVGVGASIELPLFNRNQGNIKKAETVIAQTSKEIDRKELTIKTEVQKNIQQLRQLNTILQQQNSDFEKQLQNALEKYTRNFQNRNISVLEFVDFVATYLNNMKNLIEHKKRYLNTFEELQYNIGKDINI